MFEEQQQKEENRTQNQRALLFILPLVMLAVLAVGVFFGYKFYLNSVSELSPVSPSEIVDPNAGFTNPMFLQAVNPGSPLDSGFVPDTAQSCGAVVSREAALPLEQLMKAAKDSGHELRITQAYISFDELDKRYQKAVQDYRKDSHASLVMAEAHVKKSFPPAGENELQTGLLVDFTADTQGTSFADSSAYSWLTRHCVDYGFILRYPDRENAGGMSYSSHLFRFVGKDYAYQMRSLDMDFDEFILYLGAH